MGESWNLDWFFVEDWLHAIVQLCVDEYDARMSLMSIDETGCQICRVARPCPAIPIADDAHEAVLEGGNNKNTFVFLEGETKSIEKLTPSFPLL